MSVITSRACTYQTIWVNSARAKCCHIKKNNLKRKKKTSLTMSVMTSRACTSMVMRAVMIFLCKRVRSVRTRAARQLSRVKDKFSNSRRLNITSPTSAVVGVVPPPFKIPVTSLHHTTWEIVRTICKQINNNTCSEINKLVRSVLPQSLNNSVRAFYLFITLQR